MTIGMWVIGAVGFVLGGATVEWVRYWLPREGDRDQ